MCLYSDLSGKGTSEFLTKHQGKKEITVWKAYEVWNSGIVLPIYNRKNRVKPGWIKSDRKSKLNDIMDDTSRSCKAINRGIHVSFTREEARNWRDVLPGHRVFKCTALLNDLVAVGNESNRYEAVFMKIYISPEEFEKGKKGRN